MQELAVRVEPGPAVGQQQPQGGDDAGLFGRQHAAPGQVGQRRKANQQGGQHGKTQGGAAAVQRLAVGAGQADFPGFHRQGLPAAPPGPVAVKIQHGQQIKLEERMQPGCLAQPDKQRLKQRGGGQQQGGQQQGFVEQAAQPAQFAGKREWGHDRVGRSRNGLL